jgi:voltage-gated potassium channel
MLQREIQRRIYRLVIRISAQLNRMRIASRQQREFFAVLLEGAQIQQVSLGLGITILTGTLGYTVLEGWNIFDAFYMTIISLTTVGFGEIHPLSTIGRGFTVIVILAGVAIVTYSVSSAVEYVATGQVLRRLHERHLRERLATMENHFIVAGFGRVGREVAGAFVAENIAFIVIDPKEDAIHKASELGYPCILGTATEDQNLLAAGIDKAHGLVACAGDDATNVYTVLTARGLNEKLLIIARATDENSEAKMLRAGANRVISPYVLSGRRMANLAVRPYVVDFLDITSESSELEQMLEEIVVEDGSIIFNQTIGQVDLRRRTGANILALHLPNGEWLTNPTAATRLEPGTRLIVLGNRDQLDVTEALTRRLSRYNASEETEIH